MRPADKRAKLLVSGAGALVLLGSVCGRIGTLFGPERQLALVGSFLSSPLSDAAGFVIAAVAAVLLARSAPR